MEHEGVNLMGLVLKLLAKSRNLCVVVLEKGTSS